MSGWRSGSGSPGLAIEATDWSPSRRAMSPRERVVSAILLTGLFAFVLVAWIVHESHRPPHRTLPPPLRSSVVLVPVGDMPRDRVDDLARDYSAEYGLSVTLANGIPLPPAAYDPARRQYVAQDLIAAAVAARPDAVAAGSVVIGLTAADIYIRGVNWNWAFAQRHSGQLAVVSLARMPNGRYDNQEQLFRKMLTRQIGFLCYGLAPTENPYDVLYRDILGVDDLERIFDHL